MKKVFVKGTTTWTSTLARTTPSRSLSKGNRKLDEVVRARAFVLKVVFFFERLALFETTWYGRWYERLWKVVFVQDNVVRAPSFILEAVFPFDSITLSSCS
jgi:hypothetical protein